MTHTNIITPKNAPIYIEREREAFRRLARFFVSKVALAAAFVFFGIVASTATAQTLPEGLSIDNDYQSGQDGYYYVNMIGGDKTITIPNGFTSSFKVYDDGGKKQPHAHNWYGYLLITAPEGFFVSLRGTAYTSQSNNTYLAIYDNNTDEDSDLKKYSKYKPNESISVSTTGRYMLIHFVTGNNTNNRPGLDFTVTLSAVD